MGHLSLGKIVGSNGAGECPVSGNDEDSWERTPVNLQPLAHDRRSWSPPPSSSWEEAGATVSECMKRSLQSQLNCSSVSPATGRISNEGSE